MRKVILAIVITAVVCIAGTASFFWWMTAPKLNKALSLLNQTTHGGATVLRQFESIGNLEGFVVQSTEPGQSQGIVYADNQGRYLIFGTIIDSTGQNISNQDYQTYIQPASASLAFNYIANVTYIQQGANNAPHQAYILFDPNCVFCHRLFQAVQPAISSGQLAVRWIPVAFLKPTSKGRVYAMLSSQDPLAVMQQNEANFDEQSENGGVPPLTSASTAVEQQLQNNMAFLTETQINSTPTILYKTSDGTAKIANGVDPAKLEGLIQSFSSIF